MENLDKRILIGRAIPRHPLQGWRKMLLAAMVLLSFTACKKEQEEAAPQILPPSVGEIKKEIAPRSVRFQYHLPVVKIKETGVILATDPAGLKDPASGYHPGRYVDAGKFFQVDIEGLEPYTRYFYKLKVTDQQGRVTYSQEDSFYTKGFNLTWDGRPDRKTTRGNPLGDVHLVGEHIDTVRSQYQAFYEDKPCELVSIKSFPSGQYYFSIRLPGDAPLGRHNFRMEYRGLRIMEEPIEVLKGYIKKISQNPYGLGPGAFFTYQDKVYAIAGSFCSWDPATYASQKYSLPAEIRMLYGSGNEIDGRIYFQPQTTKSPALDPKLNRFEEFLYNYDPVSDHWERVSLYMSGNSNDELSVIGTFVLDRKLYCFVRQYRPDSKPAQRMLLKAFDPATGAWTEVMDIKGFSGEIHGFRTVVHKGRIYVLVSLVKSHFSASVDYKNEFYELDLPSQTWIKKSIWNIPGRHIGMAGSHFFEHKGHLYVFGGVSVSGFVYHSNNYALEYAPESDTWTPLASTIMSIYPSPTAGNFCYVIKDKVYIGLGEANDEPTKDIYELDLN